MYKIFSEQTKQHNIKYTYGVKVTRKFKGAIKFYPNNGNTLWQDEIGKEMAQIKYFQTFMPLKRGFIQ